MTITVEGEILDLQLIKSRVGCGSLLSYDTKQVLDNFFEMKHFKNRTVV